MSIKTKIRSIIFAITCFVITGYGGDIDRIPQYVHINPMGILKSGSVYFAGGGAGLADSSNVEGLLYNPTLPQTKRWSAAAGMSYRQRNELTKEFTEGGQVIYPAYLMLAASRSQWTYFAAYDRFYDQRQIYRMEITTITEPNGTGEFIEIDQRKILHRFSGGANRRLNDVVTLGISGGLNILYLNEEIYRSRAKATDVAAHYGFGVTLHPAPFFAWAWTFHYHHSMEFEPEIDGLQEVKNPDDGSDYTARSADRLKAELPWTMRTGLTLRPLNWLVFNTSFDYFQWPENYPGDNYHFELHGGVRLRLVKRLLLRSGFYIPGHFSDGATWDSRRFVTLGISAHLTDKLVLTVSVSDSRLFSLDHPAQNIPDFDNLREQTDWMTGLRFSL